MAEKKSFPDQAMVMKGPPGRNPAAMERVKLKNQKETLRRLWEYLSEKKVVLIVSITCVDCQQ